MFSITIWVSALVLYLIFYRWYNGSRRPLSEQEIEHFMSVVKARSAHSLDSDQLETLRTFMQQDDGREFLMVNLVKFNPSPVTHPDTGERMSANNLLNAYFKPLTQTFLPRAGHPVMTLPAVGGYLDSLDTPPDPGWSAAAIVRYRSRRDAMQTTLANADFDEIYHYKLAALRETLAFPTQLKLNIYTSPRVMVAMGLALLAAILQLLLIV